LELDHLYPAEKICTNKILNEDWDAKTVNIVSKITEVVMRLEIQA